LRGEGLFLRKGAKEAKREVLVPFMLLKGAIIGGSEPNSIRERKRALRS